MKPEDLSKRIISTYFWLRIGMGVIALIFPVLLWIGGKVFGDLSLQGSMSAYYHAGNGVMRDWFVGILFAIGIMLFLYQGFTNVEDYALNAAGVLTLGIALFPMTWPGSQKPLYYGFIHGLCAILFFICIGYVCIFHADDTLELLKRIRDEKTRRKYRRTYKILGVLMITSPLIAASVSATDFHYYTFYVEAVGVWVFATYWLVKSQEVSLTRADEKAAKGEIEVIKDVNKAGKEELEFIPEKTVPAHSNVSIPDLILGKVSVRERLNE